MEILLFIGILVIVGFLLVLGAILKTINAVRRTVESDTVRTVVKISQHLLDRNGNPPIIPNDEPEKPKSISDLTSVYLGTVAKDFPDLNVRELITAAENKLCLLLTSIGTLSEKQVNQRITLPDRAIEAESVGGTSGDTALGITENCVLRIRKRTDELSHVGSVECFENITVRNTGIRSYHKQGATCVLLLQSAVAYHHYVTRNGTLIAGNREKVDEARYDMELLYVIDPEKLPFSDTTAVSPHCPNCGAAVKGTGDKFCEFCGAAVHTIDIRLWRVNAFVES